MKPLSLSGLIMMLSFFLTVNLPCKAEQIIVTVDDPGTLSQKISPDKKFQITDLKVNGSLNGIDIRFIREMAGSDYYGNETDGKLAALDLGNVNIIGGDPYYMNESQALMYIAVSDKIGPYMFYACKSLQTIVLPSGITAVEDGYSFIDCPGLISVSIDPANQYYKAVDGVLYNKAGTELTYFPTGKSGYYPVANGVDKIAARAFAGCKGLTGVTIPNSVREIEESAFMECYALASITIPDNVETVGKTAFSMCFSLASVTIGAGVSSIGEEAFSMCSELESLTVSESNAAYKSVNDVLFNKQGTVLLCFPGKKAGNYVIPEGVEEIATYAFASNTGLVSVIMPQSVTSVGNAAFWGCSDLNSVTMGNGVSTIGQYVFGYCNNLQRIEMGEGNVSYKSIDGVLFNKSGTELTLFPAGRTEYVIPDGTLSVGMSAFAYAQHLLSVTIPDGLHTIYSGAFLYCSNLSKIYSVPSTPPVCNGYLQFMGIDLSTCVLYVPKGELNTYKTTAGWNIFQNIEEYNFSGTDKISADGIYEVARYNTLGQRLKEKTVKGINILQMSDGTTRKIFIP